MPSEFNKKNEVFTRLYDRAKKREKLNALKVKQFREDSAKGMFIPKVNRCPDSVKQTIRARSKSMDPIQGTNNSLRNSIGKSINLTNANYDGTSNVKNIDGVK